jgi:hypothetical protein
MPNFTFDIHLFPTNLTFEFIQRPVSPILSPLLVPTMGILGIGIMNSTAFSLLANISAGIDESQEMELTIGSLSILIGPSGLTRLSDSTKPDPSMSEPETAAMMESSEGSSSEVNSPVSLGEAKITEGDEIWEKLDTEVKAFKTHSSTRDFAAGSSGISKKSTPVMRHYH